MEDAAIKVVLANEYAGLGKGTPPMSVLCDFDAENEHICSKFEPSPSR
jgi:hypothetical protein